MARCAIGAGCVSFLDRPASVYAAEAIAKTFRAICAQPVADDGVTFDVAALMAAPICEKVEYGGVRVRTTATIAGARIPILVDIGFGDAVTPAPVDIDYPALLDAPPPHLRCLSHRNGGGREIRGTGYARHCQQPAQGFLRSLADRGDIRP